MRVRRGFLYSAKLMLAGFVLVGVPAVASETTTYTYDALGRLVTTSVSGGPTNGLSTTTQFDPAGNRTNYQVTGAPPPRPRRLIVLPLNGFTVIPLP